MDKLSAGNKADFLSMTNNEVIVYGGKFGDGNIAGAWADDVDGDMNVSSNTVIITGGIDIRNVYGGSALKGTVSSSTVTISNSVTIGEDVYGAWIGNDGLASSNTVTITSGTVGQNVYGGYIHQNGTATLNKVNLTGVTVGMDVYGAKIGNDERAEGEAEKVGGDGLASSNTVTITSGTVGRDVYGGYIVNNGTAILNKVNLTSVTVRLDVYGAKIGDDGLASSNTVIITSGTVGQNVYGGYIVKKGTAILNKVNLSDVDVTRDVYGAKIGMGLASSNEVTITGGRVGEDVLGGYIWDNGTATGNKVNLTDVDVTRDVYGAMVGTDKKAEFERAMEEATEAYEKVLALSAKYILDTVGMDGDEQDEFRKRFKDEFVEFGEIACAVDASERALSHLAKAAFERAGKAEKAKFEKDEKAIIGDKAQERVLEPPPRNKAEIKERIKEFKVKRAELKKDVIAEIERAEAKRAKTYVLASSNTVTITSGTVGRNVYGGYIHQNGTATLNKVNLTSVTATKDVYGAWIGGDGLASSNTVTIINGEAVQNVYGGYIVKDGTATGNTVTISGGKVKGNVFGGYVGGNGEATYNTIKYYRIH